jgi:hypothetical protein
MTKHAHALLDQGILGSGQENGQEDEAEKGHSEQEQSALEEGR